MKRSLITMKLLGMLGTPKGTPPIVERYAESKTEISEMSDIIQSPANLFETFLFAPEQADCDPFAPFMAIHNAYAVMHSEVAA